MWEAILGLDLSGLHFKEFLFGVGDVSIYFTLSISQQMLLLSAGKEML